MSNFNIGDKVIMNSKYYVSDKNKGIVFTVISEPWNLCGSLCVLLDGFSGGYSADGLDKVELTELKPERVKTNEL